MRPTAARSRPSTPPRPRARARRGSHRAFWLFSAFLISALVVSVVALNAMVVNTTYRLQAEHGSVDALTEQHMRLSTRVARLSSPALVADWAELNGLAEPGLVVSVRVPGVEGGA